MTWQSQHDVPCFLCLQSPLSSPLQASHSNYFLQSSGRRLAALSPHRRPSSDRGKALRSDTGLEAAPHEIRELLAESHHWDFDIIKLERLTERRSTVNTAV